MQHQLNAFRVTMIFPRRYSGGNPIPASVWNHMTTELRELQADLADVPVKGEWRSEDDENRLYLVTVRTLERVESLRDFAQRWRTAFRQRALYFDYHPVCFELIGDE